MVKPLLKIAVRKVLEKLGSRSLSKKTEGLESLVNMKYTPETPKRKGGFSAMDLVAKGKITNEQAIGGLFNPISFGKGGMKLGPDASNLNSSRIEISTFTPSTPGPPGFGMKVADDIGLPATKVGNKSKDAIKVETNLIEKKGQWEWEGTPPDGFKDNTHLVTMNGGDKLQKAVGKNLGLEKGPSDHAYATKVVYEKGGNLTTYDTRAKSFRGMSIPESRAEFEKQVIIQIEQLKKKLKKEGKSPEEIKKKVTALRRKLNKDYKGDNPKGRPTTKGIPVFGKKIGEIRKRDKIHPVYDQIIMRSQGGLISLNEGGGIDDYGISADDMQEAYAEAGVDIFGPDLTEEDFDYTDADILAGQRAKGSTRPDDTVPGDLGPEEAQILSRDRSFFTKSPQEVLAMTSMTPQQIRDKQGGDFGESTPMLTFDTIVYEGLPTEEGSDWTEEGGLRTDFYNRIIKNKEKNLMNTLKSLGQREQRELDTLYKGWRTLDPKDYPPEVIDYINQLKQDRPDIVSPLSDFAYTKRGQARSKNVLDNIQDNRDKAMGLLSDSGTSSNIYRKGGGKIMAGGLSGMNRGMMIGGQPYRLSYIDPRQAKVGGPVIRRQDGGEVDMYGTATPDMDYTEDDFTSYADKGIDVNIPDVGYMGDFAFAPDPQGRVGLMGPDEVAGVDIAQTYLSPDPESSELGVYETQSGLERFVANLLPDSLNKNLNISKDPQRFVSDKELENRYGDRAGLQKDLINLNNKYAFNLSKSNKTIQDKEAEEIEKQGFVSSKREGEIKRDSAVEAAKKTFGEDNFREFKGIDYPAYMPGGTAVAIGNFIAKMAGVIGTAEVRGVPVHVKEDGSISVISPENEPGFDQSKMDLGNEPTPSRKRLPVSTAAATSQDEAETPKTGMAGLLARRSAPASRSESNVFLSRLLDNIYGTDRSKMLG